MVGGWRGDGLSQCFLTVNSVQLDQTAPGALFAQPILSQDFRIGPAVWPQKG